jgi:hypothetical protein
MASRFARLNSRVVTAILLVALPVLIAGAALVIGIGQNRLRRAESVRLGQIAEYTAATVDAYVFRRILDAAILGRVPDVREAAAGGSSVPSDPARLAELEKAWHKDRASAIASLGILKTPASRFLAELVKNDSVYREVLVTDRQGRLVAASNATTDFDQSDEAWWVNAFDEGRGRISVTDVRRDESAHVYAFEIAVPVLQPDDSGIAGVMKIVADSREMLAGIAGLELGATSEAMLVRPDGSIVFSRRPYSEGDRFFAAGQLQAQMNERASRKEVFDTVSYEAPTSDGARRIVAVAPSQLSRSYPELAWLMAVSMDVDELTAPFQSLVWYLVLVVGLTGLAVLAIAVWFSLRLASPPIDPAYDMHLVEHARIPRMEDAESS